MSAFPLFPHGSGIFAEEKILGARGADRPQGDSVFWMLQAEAHVDAQQSRQHASDQHSHKPDEIPAQAEDVHTKSPLNTLLLF